MDQKHAMLYPDPNAVPAAEQRSSAAAAIGLPMEAPPSYDIAMGAGSSSTSTYAHTSAQVSHGPMGWSSNVPAQAAMATNQHFPVIVEQPKPISNTQYSDQVSTSYQSPNLPNSHPVNVQSQQQAGTSE